MIETVVYNYLKNTINTDVFMQRPEKVPKQYVVIEKTGNSKTNHVPTATMAFQSYAERLSEAAALNEAVKEAVEGMADLPVIGSAHLITDYNFTNTDSKQYRYQAVFEITHQEEV